MKQLYFAVDDDFSFGEWCRQEQNKKYFPEYFGENLDAFYDVMTETKENVTIKIVSEGRIKGKEGKKLLKVVEDIIRANRHVFLVLEQMDY